MGPSFFFEFDISQEGFLEWMQSEGRKAEINGDEPFTILRFLPNDDDLDVLKIQRGYYFEEMSEPDAGIHIAYDLDSGRAYWFSHTR